MFMSAGKYHENISAIKNPLLNALILDLITA